MSKFGRYLLAAVVICAIGVAVHKNYRQEQKIDTSYILAHSVLKDKTFASEVQQIETGGMKAYLLEEHSNPIIAVSFVFENSGAAHEPENKLGLVSLLDKMLMNGAGRYDALQFKDISEEYGVNLGFSADDDDIDGYLQMPTAGKDMAVELLTSVLYKPHFTYDYIALTKNRIRTALRNTMVRPNGILADSFAEIMYAGHPYARTSADILKHIDGISRGDLLRYMRSHFTKENIIIGIAGDITATEAAKLIDDLFGRLPARFEDKSVAEIDMQTSGKNNYVERDFPQTLTAFVSKGTKRNSADFYPLYIANHIFGGSGLSSRISKVIREEKGLTYGIYTYLSPKFTAPLLLGGFSSTPENFEKARSLLLEEWQKIATQGVNKEELELAKNAMISSHNLRFASTAGIADMLVAMQQYDLGADFLEKRNDYVRAVTLEQVNTAAAKYYKTAPDFVIVGTKIQETEEEK